MFNPAFRYLRVQQGSYEAYMVLGELDKDAQGQVQEVWYSAQREILRLRNGQVVGTAGLGPINWDYVVAQEVSPSPSSSYERTRYFRSPRSATLHETVWIHPVATPPKDLLRRFKHAETLGADLVQWQREDVQSGDLPSAYLGFERSSGQAVAGHQCLSETFCLQWERVPR